MAKKLVYGSGVNDAEYTVTSGVSGKRISCKLYKSWYGIMQRCFSDRYKSKHPTYQDCTVCDEWLVFSNFKAWAEKQDWQGKHLDKDLLIKGNKHYSPETCLFISPELNKFMTENKNMKSEDMIGFYYYARDKAYISRCCNPITGIRETLGYFKSPKDAHLAWLNRKRQIAVQLAGMQEDKRVAEALIRRYPQHAFIT